MHRGGHRTPQCTSRAPLRADCPLARRAPPRLVARGEPRDRQPAHGSRFVHRGGHRAPQCTFRAPLRAGRPGARLAPAPLRGSAVAAFRSGCPGAQGRGISSPLRVTSRAQGRSLRAPLHIPRPASGRVSRAQPDRAPLGGSAVAAFRSDCPGAQGRGIGSPLRVTFRAQGRSSRAQCTSRAPLRAGCPVRSPRAQLAAARSSSRSVWSDLAVPLAPATVSERSSAERGAHLAIRGGPCTPQHADPAPNPTQRPAAQRPVQPGAADSRPLTRSPPRFGAAAPRVRGASRGSGRTLHAPTRRSRPKPRPAHQPSGARRIHRRAARSSGLRSYALRLQRPAPLPRANPHRL